MGRYIVRRLTQVIPLLILVTLISYGIILAAPGGPEQVLLAGDASANIDTTKLAELRKQWGIDDPWYEQYYRWATNLLKGDFGYSLTKHRPVLELIMERLPATLLLGLVVTALIYLIALPIGILSAVRQYSVLDYGVTVLGLLGHAMPGFWVGIMLIYLVAIPTAGLIPTSGYPDVALATHGVFGVTREFARYMILPVVTLTTGALAGLALYMRTQMLEVLRDDYVRTARSKGLSEKIVVYKHAFRNAVLPIVSLSGRILSGLVGGAVIAETVFAWPGMGRLFITAARERDYAILMAILLISVILDIAGQFLVDFIYVWVDPRIRYS